MKSGHYAALTLVVILGIVGLFWLVRRGTETNQNPLAQPKVDFARGLIGYWKLAGDCRDHSGHGHHGTNHGV
ncbi:MAG: hypothetical protein FJ303_04995, partial [Planctomycetes bacterium]|nr:hypothetical protein [Planctomycetota bacterium]